MIDKIYKIGLPLIIILIAAFLFLMDPVVNDFPACPIQKFAGIYCPGCGSQRAVHALLHGRFTSAFNFNPLIYFGLFVVLYNTTVISINRFGNESIKNLLNTPGTPVVIAIIIVLFWILRNLPLEPFSSMAPHI